MKILKGIISFPIQAFRDMKNCVALQFCLVSQKIGGADFLKKRSESHEFYVSIPSEKL